MIPYLRTENLKIHTLSRGTYLYSPYMGVTPGEEGLVQEIPPFRTPKDKTDYTISDCGENVEHVFSLRNLNKNK